MDSLILNRITIYIAAFGAVLSAFAFLVAGPVTGVGAVVGASIALLNWAALRWVISRVRRGNTRTRAGLMVLLVLKMAALIALSWALITRWDVDAVGFAIGTSSLVAGVLLGSSRAGAAEEQAAREEA